MAITCMCTGKSLGIVRVYNSLFAFPSAGAGAEEEPRIMSRKRWNRSRDERRGERRGRKGTVRKGEEERKIRSQLYASLVLS